METGDRSRIGQSLSEVAVSLRVVVHSMYQFAPGAVVVGAFLSAGVVWLTMQWVALMTATAVLLVLLLSLSLFAIRGNFGEALLSLVGGLLPVFAYEWTSERYVAFSIAWIGFALFALLIASVKIAAHHQDLIRQAAIRIQGRDTARKDATSLEEELSNLATDVSNRGTLSTIKRAEVIRLFAFRDLPVHLFSVALQATETLSLITKCETQLVALFVTDFFQSLQPADEFKAKKLTDSLYISIRNTPVPPEEFFTAFEKSRRLIVSKSLQPDIFLESLQLCLSEGVPIDDVCREIQLKCDRGA